MHKPFHSLIPVILLIIGIVSLFFVGYILYFVVSNSNDLHTEAKSILIIWMFPLCIGTVMLLSQGKAMIEGEDIKKANPALRKIFFGLSLAFAILATIIYYATLN
jgi:hypothetical protein